MKFEVFEKLSVSISVYFIQNLFIISFTFENGLQARRQQEWKLSGAHKSGGEKNDCYFFPYSCRQRKCD